MKLTQKYSQIIKDSRIKEYQHLIKTFGRHNVEWATNNLNDYLKTRESFTYFDVYDFIESEVRKDPEACSLL